MKRKISVIFIFLAFIITMGCFSGFKTNNTYKVYASEEIKSKSVYLIERYTCLHLCTKESCTRFPANEHMNVHYIA